MPTMTIRNVDDQLTQRLRFRAAAHGRSVEDEVRDILRIALAAGDNDGQSLIEAIRTRFEPLGGVELEIPPPARRYGPYPGWMNDRPRHQCVVGMSETATSRSATLATRNDRDFVDCGIDVINPWG